MAEYDPPTWPSARDVVAMDSVELLDATTKLYVWVAVSAGELESVTCTVNEDVPAAVGVPEIAPALERLKPAFSDPEVIDHL